MTPCIGWQTDAACVVHGQYHGCKLDDGHLGNHRCLCGATCRMYGGGRRRGNSRTDPIIARMIDYRATHPHPERRGTWRRSA